MKILRPPFRALSDENGVTNTFFTVYVVELALRMSPMPISVQRKESGDAESVYQQVRQALEQGQPRLLEMTCEKVEGKRLSVLTSDVLAVQIYEKTAASGGSKRPGFSLDS
ncbi:conserved hypothetical protein [Synechococcus sp. CC9311]|uniref:UPF0367 protein sync_2587 n=1 Tax=Synechococcus sp. (strain CC9311) TaxID=64471 RepID=Y2587_SYNS3|nr:RecName: Full=UPF0367 protein sync_2587 [Synechococcus sp. CC9311]ABI45652.1 conserved hypothetical protein [Synechococcus sp. CC9311]